MKSVTLNGAKQLLMALCMVGSTSCGPGAEKPGATAQTASAIIECSCTYTSTEWRNTSYYTGWNVTLSLYAKRDCYNHSYCGQVQAVSHLNVAPGYGPGGTYHTLLQGCSAYGPWVYYQQYYVPHNSNSYWMSYSEGSGWKTFDLSYYGMEGYAAWGGAGITAPCVD